MALYVDDTEVGDVLESMIDAASCLYNSVGGRGVRLDPVHHRQAARRHLQAFL